MGSNPHARGDCRGFPPVKRMGLKPHDFELASRLESAGLSRGR